jgi:hypothetical protein
MFYRNFSLRWVQTKVLVGFTPSIEVPINVPQFLADLTVTPLCGSVFQKRRKQF